MNVLIDTDFLFDKNRFFLVAGPCAIEGRDMAFEIAETLKSICSSLKIPLVFKASYRKANRSRLDSFTGIGDEKAIEILLEIRDKLNLPITSDVHSVEEARIYGSQLDLVQIPAFLCRQTDLIVAAAETGNAVNIKKGQFMSPSSMSFAVEKVRQSGNNKVMLTERGSSFGHHQLVVDFPGIKEMQEFDVPVILDCTHSMQRPNQSEGVTGGKPKYIQTLAKAGIAIGVNGIFIETHPNPAKAKSDGANMLELNKIEALLRQLKLLSSISYDEY